MQTCERFFVQINFRMDKTVLLGMTPPELKEVALSCGLPPYAGGQMARWLYGKGVRSIAGMTDISKEGRARLEERFTVGMTLPSESFTSSDGTRKYLFPVTCPLGQGKDAPSESSMVEAVVIPDGDRRTLCVSSQAGCKMGCKFCMTGRQGFHGHLSAADILSQFLAIDEARDITNAVFMGMGEPFDNYSSVMRSIEVLTSDWGFGWSPKRITVSTIGVLPKLADFIRDSRCHLAVSLHDPFPEERARIMPVQNTYPLEQVLSLIRAHDFGLQRRVSFEYTMFKGFNDDIRHADALARALRGIQCRVNLIRFHRIPDFPYETSPDIDIERFRSRLALAGIICTVRASRGEDISAACGLLAGRHDERNSNV